MIMNVERAIEVESLDLPSLKLLISNISYLTSKIKNDKTKRKH